jgi:hypothetical protein
LVKIKGLILFTSFLRDKFFEIIFKGDLSHKHTMKIRLNLDLIFTSFFMKRYQILIKVGETAGITIAKLSRKDPKLEIAFNEPFILPSGSNFGD